jgi:hypothetical protein
MVASAVCALAGGPALADGPVPLQVPDNPFSLEQKTIVRGTTFLIRADEGFATTDKVAVVLRYDAPNKDGQLVRHEVPVPVLAMKVSQADARRHVLEAELPRELPDLERQSAAGGVVAPYRATLVLTTRRGENPEAKVELEAAIPSVRWAWFWGVAVVVLMLAGFQVLLKREQPARGTTPRIPATPLALTTTPVGGYSLSKAQILLWSCVTAFGLAYVYFLTLEFLAISTQVLVLLGISGGTAIATQITNDDASVARQLALAGSTPRQPRLADLVWSNGRPDIFKFQMLVFTLLTAYIVFFEIVTKYTFPAIPENLVALMGVSSAVYVSNKVVQKNQSETDRAAVEAKEKEIQGKGAGASDADRAALKTLLDRVHR